MKKSLPAIFLLFFSISFNGLFAQAPTISYSSPQTYTIGTAITPLTPTTTGVAAQGYNSSPVVLGSGFSSPWTVAVDAAGNIYVADAGNNSVKKIPVGGGAPVAIGSGFAFPTGIALDAAGNIYVADRGTGSVKMMPPGGGTPVTLATGLSSPGGLTVDAAGNIYVADNGDSVIKEIPAGGGSIISLGSGFSSPWGVAVDPSGNVYVADQANNAVKKIPAGGGTPVIVGSGFTDPYGVALDAAGNLFIADGGNSAVKVILAGSNTPVTLGSGFYSPTGVAIDGAGNVYVADEGNSLVKKVNPVGGYYLNAVLLAGLSFSNITGIISGTPATVSPATNYTVTAYNAVGAQSATLNITVNVPNQPSIAASNVIGRISACAGLASASPYIEQFTVSGSNLTSNINATAPTGFELSLAGGSGYGNSLNLTESGGTLNNTIVYVRSAASASGSIAGNVVLTSAGVTSQSVAVTGIVVALPTVNAVSNKTVANGAATTPINFTGTSNTFTWVNNNPAIGLAATGIGNIASFTAVNTGNTPITATITATPVAAGYAYIECGGSDFVSVINTVTNTVVGAPISTGPQPVGASVSPDGSRVYITNDGNGTVSVINTATNTVLSTITVGSDPVGIVVSPDGGMAYVANSGSNTVSVINTATNAVVASVGLVDSPTGITISPNGSRLYVTCYASNFVSVINTATNAGVANITVGANPKGIAVSPDGSRVYVANTNGNTLSVINASTNTVIATINVGSSPEGVALSPDGSKVYVTNYLDSDVAVINTATNAVIATVTVGANPLGISVTPDGSEIYAANNSTGTVAVINAATNTVSATIVVPPSVSLGNFITGGTSCTGIPVTFTITVNPSIPTISYSGSHTYTAGIAIAPLAPASSGVASPGYAGSTLTIGPVATSLSAVATDNAGNVYVVNNLNDAVHSSMVYKIPAGGGNPVTLGFGFTSLSALAVDFAGNVYVTGVDTAIVGGYGIYDGVYKIPVGGGSPLSVGNVIGIPSCIAVDGAGNVYVVDQINHVISEILANGGATIRIGSGNPISIAADAAGNVYVVNEYGVNDSNGVSKIPAGGGGEIAIDTGGSVYFTGIATDGAGNLYVIDGSGEITEIPAGGGSPVVIASGYSFLWSIALDGAGNIYIADDVDVSGSYLGAVNEIRPVGGYYIGPGLPAGLSFDNATGIISGTPTAASLATNYKVTAYNSSGSHSATVNITIKAPTISYSRSQTYTAGTAITALRPASSGVAAAGYSSNPVILGQFSAPYGIAVDGAGNVYVADEGTSAVYKVPAGVGTTVSIGSFSGPEGVAADAAGNVYVADHANKAVYKIPVGGGSQVSIGSGFSGPRGVAADAAGNVYVADDGGVYKILAAGGSQVTLSLGLSEPYGIAVDAAGNVYVGDNSTEAVYKIPFSGGMPVSIGSSFHEPYGVAVDGTGNVFVANSGSSLYEIPAKGGSPVAIASGFEALDGVAVDAAGNLYVADFGNGTGVKKIKPVGGYYINALPVGLSFNNSTGVISGTPTVPGPATNYTVTAYNIGGGSSATANITVNAPPAPAISYSSPQTYTQAVAITALSPTSSGVAAAGYSSTAVTIATGFNNPTGIAVDAAGNVYVADQHNGVVDKIPPGGGTPVSIGSGFKDPGSVAVDGLGNVYVTDTYYNSIYKIPAGGGATVALASGFNYPACVAVDGSGNIYLTDSFNNAVKKIPAGGGTPVIIGSGFNTPTGVTVDAAGNVYVADNGNNLVKKIPAGGGAPVIVGSGFSNPYSVAVDAAGNLFIGDDNINQVKEVPAAGGGPLVLASGFSFPLTVAVDGSGNVYVADGGNFLVKEIKPIGGYYINLPLPPGLSFHTNTGVISGTPDIGSPATNYTVTAYNLGGSNTAALDINVISANASLAGLKISNGALSPAFASSKYSYTANVSNAITSVTETPAAGFSSSTIKINGTIVASGTASAAIPLVIGPNTITTVVTAQDGVTTKTYTVTVTRAPSNDAYLSNLTVKTATLSPAFNFKTLSYTASVPNATSSVTVTPALLDVTASSLTVNGTAVASKTASGPIALAVGPNTINVVIIAQDGLTTQTYTITITRAPSSNDNLANISLSAGTLSPAFAPATTSYAAAAGSVANIKVTPTTADPTATITVNGTAVASGTASEPIALNTGTNTINVVVTAQDGETKQTYVLTVGKGSSDAYLSNLTVKTAALSPAFNFKTLAYTSNVPNATSSVTATPALLDVTASSLTVNGTAVASKTASGPIALAVGSNVIDIVVIAQDEVTTETYTITITRASGGADGYDPISVTKPAETPILAEDGILVHQGISPNGDGINDFLQIDNISQYPDNKLAIMNRNGQLVYEAKGYDNSSKVFDGHSNKNGQMQLPGTYFYQLDYIVNGITKHKSGFIVLKY